MRIGTRIMLAIVFAVALTVAGVTAMVSYELNKVFTGNFTISSKAQLDRMSAFVQIFFDTAIANTELLRDSPLMEENIENLSRYVDLGGVQTVGSELPFSERKLYNTLLEMHKKFPAYSFIYAANYKGGMTPAPDLFLNAGFDPSQRPWYLDVIRSGKTMITEAYVSQTGDVVCTVAAPVKDPNGSQYIGAIAIDINLDTINREVGNVHVGETGYMLMINDLQQIVSDPRNSGKNIPKEKRWLGKVINDLPEDVSFALKSLLAKPSSNSNITTVEIDGKAWLANIKITSGGFALILLQERDEVFAEAMGITMSILMVGVLIFIIMLGIAWLVARSIAKPVGILAEAAQSVAQGNLDAIPSDSNIFKGELGVLHQSLQAMVAKLGELITTANDKIKEAEEALTLSRSSLVEAEEAKSHAEQARRQGVLQTAEEIGVAIGQLSEGTANLVNELKQTENITEKQRNSISHTAVAIEQMNAVVNDVASSSVRTATLADQTSLEAKQGKELMGNVIVSMNKIEEQSLAMREGLEGLSVHATSIDVIVNVISDIADQTNLLALNAAIEAARAGDSGRGFAVVADEVRKLAEKTMEATKQVNLAITTIQDSTQVNMNAMQTAAAFVSQSIEVVDKASQALERIEGMVDSTANEIRSIASASEEQAATMVEINSSTQEVHQLMGDVTEGTDRANQAVTELSTLSHRLDSIVNELRKG